MKFVKKYLLAFGGLLLMFLDAHAGEYQLGEGITVGNLNIAGYVNLAAEKPKDGKAELVGDDVSLFIGGRFNKYINPFFEAEFSGISLWQAGGRPFADANLKLVLERLYNDINFSDELTLRVGKILTPVGEWNGIHAAPLVSTSTRPLTTFRSFPEYTSGLGLNYAPKQGGLPEFQFYWQPDGEIVPRRTASITREYRHSYGAHLIWSSGLTGRGAISVQHADVNFSKESQTLFGFNGRETYGRFQLEAEATYTRIEGQNPARLRDVEKGVYILASYALDDHWSLMARQEFFADRNAVSSSRNSLLGLAYRPHPAVSWKVEYVKQGGALLDIRSGIFASFSALF
jgi:hypothetical protein